ncbi:hypothetical protein ACK83U_16970 [Rhizobium sp. WW22]|uniref:hypothetical protein n=1 Tax=unclassified Rhizobium TaxID=2613769 RepID=UPI000DDA9AE8|nr:MULTISPECIES: hypothetical protein [unclassified Rhizobium]MBB3386543.1 hypothetical protein [Rhizobium sp. BK098]MBB3618247.1 hypothetical protein [Rhizobium sp. BK609]MBB3683904.1 hypothetical protein [Rhizobium sp. BK612]
MRCQAPWFHVKAYGYGAGRPCCWQGWMALVIYALVLMAFIFVGGPNADSHPIGYATAIIVPTALLIFVAWWKSDAPWRWRWGKIDEPGRD